jgi:serine/threonine protein kinase/tetratricopeptide (TPR) repeat protein
MAQTPERTVLGEYRLVRRLAGGGMADLYLAMDGGKQIAIKLFSQQVAGNPRFVQTLFGQARAASQLHHPNIVRIHRTGEDDGERYVVLEYVNGINLGQLGKVLAGRGQRLPVGLALRVVTELLEGLDHAHRAADAQGRPLRLVHRDVSPSNILLSFEGDVKISDFGIALATPAYMSPEQIAGRDVDHRSDLFSTGVVLTELLLGQHPFLAENDAATVDRVLNVRLDVVREHKDRLPPGMIRILGKALQPKVDHRYRSARAFRDDIDALVSRQWLSVFSKDDLASFIDEQVKPRWEAVAAEAEELPLEARPTLLHYVADRPSTGEHRPAASAEADLPEGGTLVGYRMDPEMLARLQGRLRSDQGGEERRRAPVKQQSVLPELPTAPAISLDEPAPEPVRSGPRTSAEFGGMEFGALSVLAIEDGGEIPELDLDYQPPGGVGDAASGLDLGLDELELDPSEPVELEEEAAVEGGLVPVVLEEEPGAGGPDFPAEGSLEANPLPWLLVRAATSGVSGTLEIAQGEVRKTIYIIEGKPIYVDSSLREEALGSCLVSRGVIDEAQLAEALQRTQASSKKLGETLIDMRLVDERTLLKMLKLQVHLKLSSALSWTTGSFCFRPGDEFRGRVMHCVVKPVDLALTVLKSMTRLEGLTQSLEPLLACEVALTGAGERWRSKIEQTFGADLLERALSAASLKRALAATTNKPAFVTMVEALRVTGLVEFVAPREAEEPEVEPIPGTARGAGADAEKQPILGLSQLIPLPLDEGGGRRAKPSEPVEQALAVPPAREEPRKPAEQPRAAPPAPKDRGQRLLELLLQTYVRVHDQTYYQILGVESGASQQEIELAHTDLRLRFSARRFKGVDLGAHRQKLDELTAIIEKAGSVLSDPAERQRYDESLATEATVARTGDPLGAELVFQQGKKQLQDGDLEGAVASFSAAAAKDPGQPDYHTFVGWALFLSGEVEAARPHLERALCIAPDSALAHEKTGIVERIHDPPKASHHLSRALDLGPPRADLYQLLKETLQEQGRHEELEQQCRQLIYRLGDHPEQAASLWIDLVGVYLQLQRNDAARMALQVAAQLDPDSPRLREATKLLDRE